jgi:hypothetical protein
VWTLPADITGAGLELHQDAGQWLEMMIPAPRPGFFVAFFPVGLNYKRSDLSIDFDPRSPRPHYYVG